MRRVLIIGAAMALASCKLAHNRDSGSTGSGLHSDPSDPLYCDANPNNKMPVFYDYKNQVIDRNFYRNGLTVALILPMGTSSPDEASQRAASEKMEPILKDFFTVFATKIGFQLSIKNALKWGKPISMAPSKKLFGNMGIQIAVDARSMVGNARQIPSRIAAQEVAKINPIVKFLFQGTIRRKVAQGISNGLRQVEQEIAKKEYSSGRKLLKGFTEESDDFDERFITFKLLDLNSDSTAYLSRVKAKTSDQKPYSVAIIGPHGTIIQKHAFKELDQNSAQLAADTYIRLLAGPFDPSSDADLDGIPLSEDRCPYTPNPEGALKNPTPVWKTSQWKGCGEGEIRACGINDNDKDGVPNAIDMCPNSESTKVVLDLGSPWHGCSASSKDKRLKDGKETPPACQCRTVYKGDSLWGCAVYNDKDKPLGVPNGKSCEAPWHKGEGYTMCEGYVQEKWLDKCSSVAYGKDLKTDGSQSEKIEDPANPDEPKIEPNPETPGYLCQCIAHDNYCSIYALDKDANKYVRDTSIFKPMGVPGATCTQTSCETAFRGLGAKERQLCGGVFTRK